MTDNEIIKALECYSGLYRNDELIDCCGCAFETDGLRCENCSDEVLKASLDLINRQKAEIERLQKENNRFADIGKMYGEIKAEAVKDFINQLKDNSFYCDMSFGYGKENYQEAVSMIEVERIANEMVGENNA